MGAQTNQHGYFTLDRAQLAEFAKHILGLLVGVVRQRIPQLIVERWQRVKDGLGPAHDPNRLSTPLAHKALAGFKLGDVDGHRRAGLLGPFAGVPRLDERHRGNARTHSADNGCGRGQEPATALVDGFTGGIADTHMLRIIDPWVGHPALRKAGNRSSAARPAPLATVGDS